MIVPLVMILCDGTVIELSIHFVYLLGLSIKINLELLLLST